MDFIAIFFPEIFKVSKNFYWFIHSFHSLYMEKGDECTGQTFQICDGQLHLSIEASKLDLPMIALHIDAMVSNSKTMWGSERTVKFFYYNSQVGKASTGCSSEKITKPENNSIGKVVLSATGLNPDESNAISFDNITSLRIQTHPHSKIEINVKVEQPDEGLYHDYRDFCSGHSFFEWKRFSSLFLIRIIRYFFSFAWFFHHSIISLIICPIVPFRFGGSFLPPFFFRYFCDILF